MTSTIVGAPSSSAPLPSEQSAPSEPLSAEPSESFAPATPFAPFAPFAPSAGRSARPFSPLPFAQAEVEADHEPAGPRRAARGDADPIGRAAAAWWAAVVDIHEHLADGVSAVLTIGRLFDVEQHARWTYAQALRAAGRTVPDHLAPTATLSPTWPPPPFDVAG